MKRWMLTCFAVLSLLAIIAGAIASPAAAAPGSNAQNAKYCQKGSWATLAASQTETVAFTSEKACTSYGAQGGTIVPLARLTMTVSQVYSAHSVTATVTGTGLAPGSSVQLERSGSFLTLGAANQQGSFSYNANFFQAWGCGAAYSLRGVSPSGAVVYGTFQFDCPAA